MVHLFVGLTAGIERFLLLLGGGAASLVLLKITLKGSLAALNDDEPLAAGKGTRRGSGSLRWAAHDLFVVSLEFLVVSANTRFHQ